MSVPAVELNNVSRWYGDVIGLNDVTCQIGPGVTAMLGMNGAGKSTMLRLITGQLRPTTGDIRVFGHEPFANPEVYRHLGYCPDIDNFYEHQTGRQFVKGLARLSGLNSLQAAVRTEEVLEMVGMTDRAGRAIQGYSKGMRQRIKLAQALLLDPNLILLDEPLNGLDPVARKEFLEVLKGLAEQGKSIIVSSHILFEVEQMTRSILLLHRGRLLAMGDLSIIRSLIDKHPHRIHLDSPEPRQIAERIAGLPYILSIEFDARGNGLEIRTREPDLFYNQLPKLVLEDGLRIDGFTSPDNNLESIFQYLVEA